MGCSVVLVTLDLVDKLSRFNEWELAAGVVLAAGAEALGSFGCSGSQLAGRSRARALLRASRRCAGRLKAMISSARAM